MNILITTPTFEHVYIDEFDAYFRVAAVAGRGVAAVACSFAQLELN